MTTIRALSMAVGFVGVAVVLPGKGKAQTCNSAGSCLAWSNSNTSVAGSAIAGTDNAGFGLEGLSLTGTGVLAQSNTGNGIKATTAGTFPSASVFANSTSTAANAVSVYGVVPNGIGVYGSSGGAWTTGAGVYGVSTGAGPGVRGAAPANGTAVTGQVVGTGFGVYGEDQGGAGYGIFGMNNSTGYGVYGLNTSSGYAVFAQGAAGGTTGWTIVSDARLKKNIKELPYGLAEMLKLRPVTYELKEGHVGTQLGLIAQEVQKVVPEVIRADGQSGTLSLNYTGLLPVAVKAIQEQQAIIKEQREMLLKQEARITSLEQRRAPAASRLPGAFGGSLALGLLPIGMFAILRKKRRDET